LNLIMFENVTLVSESMLLYLVFIWVFTNIRCVIVMLVIILLRKSYWGLFSVLVFIVQDRVSSPANFWHCILCVYVVFHKMTIEDMDTFGPSKEDSPPQVFPIGTSSSPSDASIRSLVVQAIQDYCNGKLIDDLS
jgi:hypothetical protein